MGKFIFKTSMFSLLILTFLISVNYWGDSAKIFHSGYEDEIAKIIFRNRNATNISNYDERILQKKLINKLDVSPYVLILGSSRTMLINSTYFNDKKVINNSVSGASIEDLIAIFQIYKTKNILPEKIILGIDPWLFNENNNQTRWQSLSKEYYRFVNKSSEGKESILNDKVKQLFSLSYFQASFRNIPNVIIGNSDPIATEELYNQSVTKLVDGSFAYGKRMREASKEEVNNRAQSYISDKIYSIEDFKEISPDIIAEFELLYLMILQSDIELSFFLSPYHPIVYEAIEKDYPIVLQVETVILNLAKENNIKYLGSFNPRILGIDSEGFYDGMHSKEETIKKIMNKGTKGDVYKSLESW
jgi:hypothetical protein